MTRMFMTYPFNQILDFLFEDTSNQTVYANRLIGDREIFFLSSVIISVISALEHTNSQMAYLINGTQLLTGDALFICGCGRTDVQSDDAATLGDVVTQKLLTQVSI